MRYKIVRCQKLMWRNMMSSTKSQKVSVLHYSIDDRNTLIKGFIVKWYCTDFFMEDNLDLNSYCPICCMKKKKKKQPPS